LMFEDGGTNKGKCYLSCHVDGAGGGEHSPCEYDGLFTDCQRPTRGGRRD
jgi:hypothetical protein